MVGLRKQDRELVKQIDLVEQQHEELLEEFGRCKTMFEGLRFKRQQLQKQIDNLMVTIEEKENDQ